MDLKVKDPVTGRIIWAEKREDGYFVFQENESFKFGQENPCGTRPDLLCGQCSSVKVKAVFHWIEKGK